MSALLESVGELTASERFTSRSAGKSVNSLCANEESSFKNSWQNSSVQYMEIYMENQIYQCVIISIHQEPKSWHGGKLDVFKFASFPLQPGLVNKLCGVFGKLSLGLR